MPQISVIIAGKKKGCSKFSVDCCLRDCLIAVSRGIKLSVPYQPTSHPPNWSHDYRRGCRLSLIRLKGKFKSPDLCRGSTTKKRPGYDRPLQRPVSEPIRRRHKPAARRLSSFSSASSKHEISGLNPSHTFRSAKGRGSTDTIIKLRAQLFLNIDSNFSMRGSEQRQS